MRSVTVRVLSVAAVVLAVGGHLQSQDGAGQGQGQPEAAAAARDPRVGLKPGLKDAGVAAKNLELVASLFKPAGFFDPKAPAGPPTEPERPRDPKAQPDDDDDDAAPKPGAGQPPRPRPERSTLNYANSDLAFQGDHLFLGNFHGFNTYDVEDPKSPRLIASIVCPGGQGDVSVHGNLLVMSVEQTRGRVDCGAQGVQEPVSAERFRGIRVFDISDVRKPRQVAAVQTCRGSHTHTLVSDPDDKENLYVYGSGTGSVRSAEELEGCSRLGPDKDPNTAYFSIDVIQIPLAAPEKARIVSRPRIFADEKSGAIAGLWPGGDHGPGTQRTSLTNQCHDITVFPEIGLAAGACAGNGILLDISDPVKPVRLDAVSDKNFAYWHSATFNNDGTKVIFTDEWGGGTRPRCRAEDLPTWGANAIFDVVDRKLRFGGYYKLPAPQTEQENCVAHNGSLIPVPGRDIMVQGWYQGGVSVFDFTDSSKPVEIAYFDRGPVDAKQLITAGYWSTYWYNGHIYGSEIARGIDVFRLTPSEHLSKHEIDAAAQVKLGVFNAQEQRKFTWPATSAVALAYVDQLARHKSVPAETLAKVRAAVEGADRVTARNEGRARVVNDELVALAGQLAGLAEKASGREKARLAALAETLEGRAAALK
jgi:hypothetical protein